MHICTARLGFAAAAHATLDWLGGEARIHVLASEVFHLTLVVCNAKASLADTHTHQKYD